MTQEHYCTHDRQTLQHEVLAEGVFQCKVCNSLSAKMTPKSSRLCRLAGFIMKRLGRKSIMELEIAALQGDERKFGEITTRLIKDQS